MTSEPRGLSLASFCLSITAFIAAFLAAWIPYAGIAVGLAAAVLGGIAIAKGHHKNLAVIGIMLGASAMVTSLVITIALALPPAQG